MTDPCKLILFMTEILSLRRLLFRNYYSITMQRLLFENSGNLLPGQELRPCINLALIRLFSNLKKIYKL